MDVLVLVDPHGEHYGRVKQTVALINGAQRHFRLAVRDYPVGALFGGIVIDPVRVRDRVEADFTDDYLTVIVERSLHDNWFSHEYRRSSVISVGDWERLYAPPSIRAYIAYQIAQAALVFAADLSEDMQLRLVHEPPEACMMDMCIQKPDIKLGMVAGNLCATCQASLRQYGISDDILEAIARILQLTRSEAIGRPQCCDPQTAFVAMRFSSHDENDNAYLHGIRPGLQTGGFTCMRADNRVESGQILDKVLRHLNRSRLVVVKVDENNLNVFFELGLAMGLDKEVLLISEQELVLGLPSDLRNWDCLTYERGNYDQLRDRVRTFCAENFVTCPPAP